MSEHTSVQLIITNALKLLDLKSPNGWCAGESGRGNQILPFLAQLS